LLTRLAARVSEETEGVAAFVALLGKEQKSLQEGDIESLGAYGEEKASLLARLAQLGDQRNQLLTVAGWPADKAGLMAWAASAPAAATAAERLLALAAEAKELNRLNGQLIAMQLQRTQSALAILTRSQAGSGLYGPNGQTTARTGYRFIDSA
jgi:flagella synthesis protein FlgN